MIKISKYLLRDLLQHKVIITYGLVLLAITTILFRMDDQADKAIISIMNITLLMIPLVSLIFSTIYYYNSYEFMEMVLAQPIARKSLIASLYISICTALTLSILIGMGLPMIFMAQSSLAYTLLPIGILYTWVFVAVSLWASVWTRDKAKGIGLTLMIWFYFTILYDAIVLMLIFQFSDYPLEKTTLILSSLNPIDLGRIFILLNMDISAMMGYTGAVYHDFFGSGLGKLYTLIVLVIWMIIPFLMSVRIFLKKDF